MAKKGTKQAEAQETIAPTDTSISDSKPTEHVPAALAASESHQEEASSPPQQRSLRDPFVIKTVDLDGYKLRLQQSRKYNQMQIKFGEGRSEDRPPAEIRDFVKTPEGPDGPRFHWNDEDRAWGMTIDRNAPAAARLKAEEAFEQVVQRVKEDLSVGQAR